MSDASNEKLLGFIPKEKYVHFAYMFLLVSAAGQVLYSLLSIVGISFVSATPALIVLGLLSCALAAVGLTKHKDDFTATDHAHFKYIIVLFVGFFFVYLICGGVYAISYFLGYLVTAAIGAAQSVLAWTGYNSWQGGRIITKENIRGEIETAIKNR